MKYYDGYKYVVAETFSVQTEIIPDRPIKTKYIDLDMNGLITIKDGFPWDGADGPTIDTKNTRTPSCVHDAFHWLFRNEYLSLEWRVASDDLMRQMMIDRGMWEFRANYWHWGLQSADGNAALPENKKKMLEAP